MVSGRGVLNELEFEKKMCGMQDRQLLEFVARQNYETCLRCESHDIRISSLESGNRKASGIKGSITGTITGIIIGNISYFSSNR